MVTLHYAEGDGEVLHWRVHDCNSRPGRRDCRVKRKHGASDENRWQSRGHRADISRPSDVKATEWRPTDKRVGPPVLDFDR